MRLRGLTQVRESQKAILFTGGDMDLLMKAGHRTNGWLPKSHSRVIKKTKGNTVTVEITGWLARQILGDAALPHAKPKKVLPPTRLARLLQNAENVL